MKGIDVVSIPREDFEVSFWPPKQIPYHPRSPKKPYIGKYKMMLDVITHSKQDLSFRLDTLKIKASPRNIFDYLYGRYYNFKSKKFKEFKFPEEIKDEYIYTPGTSVKGIEMVLDIPNEIEALEIELQVEITRQGKTELIEIKDEFVRSKYAYTPSG